MHVKLDPYLKTDVTAIYPEYNQTDHTTTHIYKHYNNPIVLLFRLQAKVK